MDFGWPPGAAGEPLSGDLNLLQDGLLLDLDDKTLQVLVGLRSAMGRCTPTGARRRAGRRRGRRPPAGAHHRCRHCLLPD